MEKNFLLVVSLVLLIGGMIGLIATLFELFTGTPVTNLANVGLASGAWILSSGVTIFLRGKL